MDILRLILIILGIVLIAGIYLAEPVKRRWQAYRQQQGFQNGDPYADLDSNEALGLRGEPKLPDEWVGEPYILRRDDAVSSEELEALKGLSKRAESDPGHVTLHTGDDDPVLDGVAQPGHTANDASRPAQPEEVIVLTLMAPDGKTFRGPLLLKSLQDAGLQHGDMGIFHYTPPGSGRALFSAANILEPGRFVLSEMVEMQTPGIALFMQLPNSLAGEQAWLQMRERAEQMAHALGGTLCDAQRRPLGEKDMRLLYYQATRFQPQGR